MLLIFGLRVYFRTIGQGTFHCQRCGGDRPYRHKSGRRWIHFFFIPVIPLDQVGEFVQCSQCGTRYPAEVLALPTMAQMQEALPAGMRAAAVSMLRAGDSGSLTARRRVIDAVRGAGVADYDDAAVDADLERASGPDSDAEVIARLNALTAQLAVPAREWFLAEIIRIGLADGALTEAERQAAREVAAHLGMTPAQAVGVITLTEEGASAG
ncbi:MAG TPA: zinc ribbon domain-containing protein [Streptosporangiaceae bacterium]